VWSNYFRQIILKKPVFNKKNGKILDNPWVMFKNRIVAIGFSWFAKRIVAGFRS
jgi:hypothetical protein